MFFLAPLAVVAGQTILGQLATAAGTTVVVTVASRVVNDAYDSAKKKK